MQENGLNKFRTIVSEVSSIVGNDDDHNDNHDHDPDDDHYVHNDNHDHDDNFADDDYARFDNI